MDRLNRRPNPSAESMLLSAEAVVATNASVGAGGNTNGQFKLSYDLHRLSCRDEAPSSRRRTAFDRPLRILGGAMGAAASGGEVAAVAVLRRQRWRDSPYLAGEGAGDF